MTLFFVVVFSPIISLFYMEIVQLCDYTVSSSYFKIKTCLRLCFLFCFVFKFPFFFSSLKTGVALTSSFPLFYF